MPSWTTEALKGVFRNRSNTSERRRPTTDLAKLRNNSVDIHVLTQHSYFAEPPRNRELACPNPNHHFHLGAPYNAGVKHERNQRPKPLSISYSLPCLPIIAVQGPELLAGSEDHTDLTFAEENVAYTNEDKGKQNAESKRTRRHGMQSYPDHVREDLRKVRSRSSHPYKAAAESPSHRFSKGDSPSVYSDGSSYGDRILVSSARVDSGLYEPPSWFSDEEEVKSDHLGGFKDGYLQRIMSLAAKDDSVASRAGPSVRGGLSEPSSARSWVTFNVPSLPPSPVNNGPPPRRVPPRNPHLPPVDYFLHKEEYDAAAIAQYGALPVEWVRYAAAHYKNRV
ncbi:hypothetical protein FRC07_003830 [Ceratobasidium sp. 392]|nr:hypothetical protein FRC07_003830 [Ceratobasidium sp. 392]